MATRYWINACIAHIDTAEYGLCRRINRYASRAAIRHFFRVASRLGDGMVWYALLLALPLMYGLAGLQSSVVMALTGLAGAALYKGLKHVVVRERPYITHLGISRGIAPLDRYSFPSGHTLHAVSFTWQAAGAFPELGWVLIPLAAAIAASRVVLGVHYPTDVAAGAALGSGLAWAGLSFT